MTIRAVIWDLGGVLLRTEDYTRRDALAKRLNMNRSSLEELVFNSDSGNRAQRGEIRIEQHWENLRQTLGLSPAALVDFQSEFWAGDYLDRSLVDYIRSLRPRYKTALLSNAFSDLRHMVTNVWKFSDAFDAMIVSAEVGLMKPDARLYQVALECLGVPAPQAVFVDDFLHNVEGARAVNMHAIHFRNPEWVRSELQQLLNGDNDDG
ncbi:MAG: HAD family phosphatase [Anaerolineales bacterium]|nr:HAD family phosphatase [Anaerolineales bacterium]